MPGVLSKLVHPDINTSDWKRVHNEWLEIRGSEFAPTHGGGRRERLIKIKYQRMILVEGLEREKRYEEKRAILDKLTEMVSNEAGE